MQSETFKTILDTPAEITSMLHNTYNSISLMYDNHYRPPLWLWWCTLSSWRFCRSFPPFPECQAVKRQIGRLVPEMSEIWKCFYIGCSATRNATVAMTLIIFLLKESINIWLESSENRHSEMPSLHDKQHKNLILHSGIFEKTIQPWPLRECEEHRRNGPLVPRSVVVWRVVS